MRNHRLILLCLGLLLFSACTPGEIDDDSVPTDQPALQQVIEATKTNKEVPLPDPTAFATSESESDASGGDQVERVAKPTPPSDLGGALTPEEPAVGEVPEDLLSELIADVVTEQGVNAETVEVIRAESVIWRDGSLGCPQPGLMYTQALVPGYQVILRHGETNFDYRVSDSGSFFRCEADS